MSKWGKRLWNLYKYKNSLLKNVLSLTIERRIFLKCLQKPRCLGWFKTSQALWFAVKKTRLNSSKSNFIGKSSGLSTKRNMSIILNVLFPFLSFIGVFSILKCRTLVLKTTTWWTRARHFVDGWHKSASFPTPYVVDHLTFVGKGGMDDLVWVRIFPQTSGVRNSFPDIIRCKIFFPALSTSWAIFCFSGGCYFYLVYSCKCFPLEINLQIIFFLKWPLTSSKVKLSAAKIHQTFAE